MKGQPKMEQEGNQGTALCNIGKEEKKPGKGAAAPAAAWSASPSLLIFSQDQSSQVCHSSTRAEKESKKTPGFSKDWFVCFLKNMYPKVHPYARSQRLRIGTSKRSHTPSLSSRL